MFRTTTFIGSIHTGRRTLALALAGLIALMLAASALTLAPRASAQPAVGNDAATCEYGGYTYNPGDRIVVISGAHYDTYFCGEDGAWHLVEQVVKPGPVKPPPPANRDFAAKRAF